MHHDTYSRRNPRPKEEIIQMNVSQTRPATTTNIYYRQMQSYSNLLLCLHTPWWNKYLFDQKRLNISQL